jgi:signal transduction histidine kinase
MRTLSLRLIVSFTTAFILSAMALFWISAHISRRTTGDFFEGAMKLQLQQAQRAYEAGGPPRLAQYLAETDEVLKGKRYLTDANGRDLVSGAERSAMFPTKPGLLGPPKDQDGQIVIVQPSADGRYRLLVVVPPPLGLGRFLPYFLLVAVAIAFLGWTLSVGIVSPLRRLAETVERFGRGDLTARVELERKDEIGNLARSYNSMADRIETLLTAERRLLQDVSHELRSPLARLSFAAELMKDTPDPVAAIQRMRREIERLSQLVATLLDVTSSEGDAGSQKTHSISMTALVQEIVADCSLEAKAQNVGIDSKLCSYALVKGDPELLRRAVENVLRNAIRFTPAESRVSLVLADKGTDVVVMIRDFGPGVPAEFLARIFDPFFRIDESRDGATGGTGLGLSIARRAVLLHHGSITAANASPGLRVDIVIPRGNP